MKFRTLKIVLLFVFAIICSDMDEFDAINDRINEGHRRDVIGYVAERWALPTIHPTDGRIAIVIENRAEPCLTAEELDRIIDLPDDWLTEQGYRPEQEEI